MAASNQPVGVDHLTIVPENFDDSPEQGYDGDDETPDSDA